MLKIKKFSMKSIPLAAAMTAALMFGAAAHAQTGISPAGGTPKTAEERDAAKPGKKAPTAAATKSQDDIVSPAPTGGTPKSAEERAAAKAEKKATRDAKRAARKEKAPPTDNLKGVAPG